MMENSGKRGWSMRELMRWARYRVKLQMAWHLRQHKPYQPLFVLGTGRSGSTLLLDYLGSLEGVSCLGEVLGPLSPAGLAKWENGPRRGMQHLQRSLQFLTTPIRGCKLQLYQLDGCGLSVDDLRQTFPTAKYVIIYRESLVEQHISECAAIVTGQWMVRQGSTPAQAKVKVDLERMSLMAKSIKRHYEELFTHTWLRERSVVMSYESLIADTAGYFGKQICPLLGLPEQQPKTRLVKQNTKRLEDRVENYVEVAKALERPEFRQRYAWVKKAA